MNLTPLPGNSVRGGCSQNSLARGFPWGSLSDTMLECIAIEGTHHATVHVLAQSRLQLAAGAAAHVSPSPSSGLLLAARLPGGLSGESDTHRIGAVDPTA
jgi:hypothetical protein